MALALFLVTSPPTALPEHNGGAVGRGQSEYQSGRPNDRPTKGAGVSCSVDPLAGECWLTLLPQLLLPSKSS